MMFWGGSVIGRAPCADRAPPEQVRREHARRADVLGRPKDLDQVVRSRATRLRPAVGATDARSPRPSLRHERRARAMLGLLPHLVFRSLRHNVRCN